MYAITGATGHIGRQIVEDLVSRGKKVRAIARSMDRLRPLEHRGAMAYVADVEDQSSLMRAFEGTEAVFILIPPNTAAEDFRAYQNHISEAYTKAIEKVGVKWVVNLSSVGAHLSEKAGPVNGLHDHEERLNQLKNLNIVHLRPTYFMENVLEGIDMITKQGVYGTPLKGNLPVAMIATRDVARVGAELLYHLDFHGHSWRELLGQRDLTMEEVTRILGRSIGKPDLKYVQFSYDDTERSLVGMGLSPNIAKLFVEMYRYTNEGVFKPTEQRSNRNTTPTSFEEFARTVFAAAYQNT